MSQNSLNYFRRAEAEAEVAHRSVNDRKLLLKIAIQWCLNFSTQRFVQVQPGKIVLHAYTLMRVY